MSQMTEALPPTVAAFVPDLMDRSRLASTFPGAQFVATPGELVDTTAEVVVLDLGRPGAVDALAGLSERRTVGFVSHVDTALIQAAAAAGCDRVLPRSRFFADILSALR